MSHTRTYKGKRVGVVGLSVEGRDSVRFFGDHGARVVCFDRRSKEDLEDTTRDLAPFVEEFRLGPQYLGNLAGIDLLVIAPGVHPQTPELASRKNGLEITSLTRLFFQYCAAPIIGVTGTKGKGTSSTLIFEMLKASGKTAHLGGNVGVPLLSGVDDIKPSDWVVLELSSFQLEGLRVSPHIAVVLKITQDHLANFDTRASNFHASRQAYVSAKESIVRYQKGSDIAILNMDDVTSRSFSALTKGSVKYFSRSLSEADAYVEKNSVIMKIDSKKKLICTSADIALRGIHNLENIAAAALAAHAAGATPEAITKAAHSFKGLPYRLEFIRQVRGVSYYDDSFSTIPETTVAAIEAFDEPKILILGGSEKRSDFAEMGKVIAKENVSAVIVIGQMTTRIITSLDKAGYEGTVIEGLTTMHDSVKKAQQLAKPGDVVLLTPACASFDMFDNYKERGDQFNHEVTRL